jgi:hypothetical protein
VNILERNGGDTAADTTATSYRHDVANDRRDVADNWTVDSQGNQVPRSSI